MLLIGLTGGIGSGKSTVCTHFAKLGVPVIDADVIAHELVKPDQPALREIINTFGDEFLNNDQTLNREKLRKIVFIDPGRRSKLESILHPRIRNEMLQRASELEAPYCLLSIPLLIETGQVDMVDRVLVIDTDEENQRARIKQRDHLSNKEIDYILQAQSSREERLDIADDVIINNDDLDDLFKQIEQIHNQYLAMAGHETNKA